MRQVALSEKKEKNTVRPIILMKEIRGRQSEKRGGKKKNAA